LEKTDGGKEMIGVRDEKGGRRRRSEKM